jgi:hypothetical protein
MPTAHCLGGSWLGQQTGQGPDGAALPHVGVWVGAVQVNGDLRPGRIQPVKFQRKHVGWWLWALTGS